MIQLGEIVGHQHDVGGFQCHVGTGRAHGHAHGSPSQSRGVVDSVADHGDGSAALTQAGDDGGLFIRQQFRVHFINAGLAGDGRGHAAVVARSA